MIYKISKLACHEVIEWGMAEQTLSAENENIFVISLFNVIRSRAIGSVVHEVMYKCKYVYINKYIPRRSPDKNLTNTNYHDT